MRKLDLGVLLVDLYYGVPPPQSESSSRASARELSSASAQPIMLQVRLKGKILAVYRVSGKCAILATKKAHVETMVYLSHILPNSANDAGPDSQRSGHKSSQYQVINGTELMVMTCMMANFTFKN